MVLARVDGVRCRAAFGGQRGAAARAAFAATGALWQRPSNPTMPALSVVDRAAYAHGRLARAPNFCLETPRRCRLESEVPRAVLQCFGGLVGGWNTSRSQNPFCASSRALRRPQPKHSASGAALLGRKQRQYSCYATNHLPSQNTAARSQQPRFSARITRGTLYARGAAINQPQRWRDSW